MFIIYLIGCDPANNGGSCCTSSNQCGEGEGDCDGDSDCRGNLVCGTDNCNGPSYMSSWMDCCETPAQGKEDNLVPLLLAYCDM